ncbi:MAG: tyrosine-protein phosphatase [Clostridia bacterium]|nr:tyrosine-protein phosphatase [Clostridia bacterium]
MKRIRIISLFLALLLLASALSACKATDEGEQNQAEEPALSVTYELLVHSDDPHTEAQRNYLQSKNYDTPTADMDGKEEHSKPNPIILKWNPTVVGARAREITEVAVISEDATFSDPIRIASSSRRVELYNVKVGQTLYWYVEGTLRGETFKSEIATVTVVDAAPRNLDVHGVKNCRDLGGWKTADGGIIQQGKAFRTGGLTGIKSDGEQVLLKDLGIKTEIDLRTEAHVTSQGDSTDKSHLGDKINYVFAPMDDAASNLLTDKVNEASLLKVFEVFGDEANYPILFHCNVGTDRTGLVAFLLLGLCGVEEESLYRDYLFSNFASLGKQRSGSVIATYLGIVSESPGDTLAEQIENYLLSRGVTADQIATIKKMLKG